MDLKTILFGKINRDGSVTKEINGRESTISVYIQTGISKSKYESEATDFLFNIKYYDTKARNAIYRDYQDMGSNSRFYIQYHLDNFYDEIKEKLSIQPTIEDLINLLEIIGLSITINQQDSLSLAIDYSICKDISDEILVVVFEQGKIKTITCES